MGDLSTTLILLIVNAYVLLALLLFSLSASDLVCQLKQGHQCAKRRRTIKCIVAVPLMLSCLALLASGLFAIGISHGSRPKDYQILFFVLGCFTPFFLLIFWVIGSLWVDALWVALTTALLVYLLFVNPAIYVTCWGDDNYQWAQLWIARHYETGKGGLSKSDSSARVWYKKAAENGNQEAQYKIAQLERRSKNAKKWYLLAAEQGHADAMVQVARLARNKEERQVWLNRAASQRHPEALFMLAQDTATTDLPTARQLLLEAAENGSRSAILSLISQYQQGGIFFDQNSKSANQWQSVLTNTPASEIDLKHLTPVTIDQTLNQAQDTEWKTSANEPETLYRKAQLFLQHPAKDQILHNRAIDYLARAANKGYGEAAIELAEQAMKNSPANTLNEEALKWYEVAAINDNQDALKYLTKYYKEKPDANITDLKKSLEHNTRLLNAPQVDNNTRQRLQQQHWSAEYRDTQKKLAQFKRLGGSWQNAINQAKKSPHKEYLLAKELIDNRQYTTGMEHMKSAAKRGNQDARYELARRTLQGPRSFTQEIDAVTELQTLDQLGFLAASVQLGMIYQSGTGIVPKNHYLARQLYRKAQADENLSEKALRMLESTPGFTDNLELNPDDNPRQKIIAWYKQTAAEVKDLALLQQQYEALLDHFSDIEQLQPQAINNDAKAQYKLAQSLQSHNLAEAMQWLQRAATNGNSNAQYELSVRMIRGKKNPPETQQALKNWAITAANNGHVGAMVFLATQFKSGYGGFEKNIAFAKKYYLQVLQNTDADIVFEGKIAGRSIEIKRSNIQKNFDVLKNSEK